MLLLLALVLIFLALLTIGLWEWWKTVHRRDSHYEPVPMTGTEERRLRRLERLSAERHRLLAALRTRLHPPKRPEVFHREWAKWPPKRRRRKRDDDG